MHRISSLYSAHFNFGRPKYPLHPDTRSPAGASGKGRRPLRFFVLPASVLQGYVRTIFVLRSFETVVPRSAAGTILEANARKKFEGERLVESKTLDTLLPNPQIVEYLRAFISTRTAWGAIGALVIIPGEQQLRKSQRPSPEAARRSRSELAGPPYSGL